MTMFKDTVKTLDLMKRVYNNKMQFDTEKGINDEEAIKVLCNAVFNDGSVTPDPSTLHQFNNIIVKVADEIAQPDLEKMIKYFADYENVPANTQLYRYDRPQPVGLKFKWTASGSDISFKRVESGKQDFIEIGQVQTGITYYPITKNETCVENFRRAVNEIASAKVKLIYDRIMALIQANISGSGLIPASQILDKANSVIAEFNSKANVVARRTGGKPIFVADQELITYYANLIQTGSATILIDSIKEDLYNFNLTDLRTAVAIPMVNKFTSRTGTETDYPINRGYLIGNGGNGTKPFKVILAGGLTQNTSTDFIHGKVNLSIRQGLGIDLCAGENMGYVEEDSITSL